MTKDLALLVGPDQNYLTTEGFIEKVAQNFEAAMGKAWGGRTGLAGLASPSHSSN
jgi:hypothetical protein